MKRFLPLVLVLACQSRVDTASVGLSVKGLTATDDGVGFSREEIASIQLTLSCEDGTVTTLAGVRDDTDHFVFRGAPVCDKAALDVVITRTTEAGAVTAIIGSAEAAISAPRVDVVFKAKRFGELVVSYEAGTRECTVTTFEETPHRHAAEVITVTAAPVSPAIALQVGTYTVACDGASWVVSVPFAERLITTQPAPAVAPNDATLSALGVLPGVLRPAFTPTTFDYVVRLPPETFLVAVTATASNSKATITLGTNVGTGVLSAEASGSDTPFGFFIDVTSEDGTQTQRYTFEAQTMSSDASLVSLSVAPGRLAPAFSSASGVYFVEVPDAVRAIQVDAAASAGALATVRINNVAASSVSVPLTSSFYTFTIDVIAEDGTTQTNTITVRRGLLSALSTQAGTLSPSFTPIVRRYEVGSPTGGTFLVSATPASPNIEVTINGVTGPTGLVVATGDQPNKNVAVIKAVTPDNLSEEYWVSIDCGFQSDIMLVAGSAPTGEVVGYNVGVSGDLTTGSGPAPTAGDITSLVANAGSGHFVGATTASGSNPFRSFSVLFDASLVQNVGPTAAAPYRSLTFTPSGTRAFVHNGALQIRYFDLDTNTGATVSIPQTLTLSSQNSITSQVIEPAGRSLYVATSTTIFRVTNLGTIPSQATDSIAHAGTTELLAHPSGAALYAVAGNTLTTFLIDRVSGQLRDPVTTTLTSPIQSLAISRSGASVAAAHTSATLSLMTADEEGRITSVTTAQTRNGDPAHLVAFQSTEPDLLLYTVENAGADDFVRAYNIDPAGALINPASDVTSPPAPGPGNPPASIRFLVPFTDFAPPA
jgi:hypothetical protein